MHFAKALAVTAFAAGAYAGAVQSSPDTIVTNNTSTTMITSSDISTTETIAASKSPPGHHFSEPGTFIPFPSTTLDFDTVYPHGIPTPHGDHIDIAYPHEIPTPYGDDIANGTVYPHGIPTPPANEIATGTVYPHGIPTPPGGDIATAAVGGTVFPHGIPTPPPDNIATAGVTASSSKDVVVGALLTEPRGSVVTALSVKDTTGVASVEGTTISWRHDGVTLDNGDVVSVVFDGIADSTTTAEYQKITLPAKKPSASDDVVTKCTTTLTTETVPMVVTETIEAGPSHEKRYNLSRVQSMLESLFYTLEVDSTVYLVNVRGESTRVDNVTRTETTTAPASGTTTFVITGKVGPIYDGRKHDHKGSNDEELYTKPGDGILTVQTTVLFTVTSIIRSPAHIASSTSTAPASDLITLTDPINPTLTEVINNATTTRWVNNTSIDTVSFDNPLTFSMSGLVSSSTATPSTSSGIQSSAVSVMIGTSSSSLGDTLGYTGAIASNLASAASKAVKLDDFCVSTLVATTMGVCLGLALLL